MSIGTPDSNLDQPNPPPDSAEAVTATPSPGPEPPPEPSFQQLDPRVINLWRLEHLIGSFFLLGISLVGCIILALNFSGAAWWVFGAWLGLAALRAWLLFWYPSRSYQARGYRIDEKVLETRRGIWFRVVTLLPLSRLQHVALNRGPLERMFGLASLVLHTAGTQHSMVVIPGLDPAQATRLRDHLVSVGGDDAV